MKQSLGELVDRIETGVDRLLDRMSSMTPKQRSFRAESEAWSPNEVAHHLLLVQTLSVSVIEKNRGRPSARPSLTQRLGRAGVAAVLRFGIKVKNPAPPTTPDPAMTFEELEPLWSAERARLRKLVEPMAESNLGEAGFRHPISGPLSVGESLDFLACHLEHHHRQLDRIRASPGFPAA